MDHDQIQTRLSAYLDGELPDPLQREIQSHLAVCARCNRVFNQLQAITAQLSSTPLPTPSPAAINHLHQLVDTLTQRRIERFTAMLSALAACVALAGAVQLMSPAGNASASPSPSTWEGDAVHLTMDSHDAASSHETVMTQWLATNLSPRQATSLSGKEVE